MDLYGILMRLTIQTNICVIKVKHLVSFSRMGVANVGTDSLLVHVYLNDPMTKLFLKELKPF